MKKILIALMALVITLPLQAQDIINKLGGNTSAVKYDIIDSGDNLLFRVQGDKGVLFNGTINVGAIPIEGPGTRMMWYPKKAAFRVGRVNGAQWNDVNIGLYSIAMGFKTTASGDYSTAMGDETTASGDYSTAMGDETTASGFASTAMGQSTTASGMYSTAMGNITEASEMYSTAMGRETIASGQTSTAMGIKTKATGWASTAMGGFTLASGTASTAMGFTTIASGAGYSTAMGKSTTASGENSTAMGNSTTASGPNSIAMGAYIEAAGSHSIAIALNDQHGTKVTQANTMSIMGGKVGIGTVSPNAVLSVVGLSEYADNSAATAGGLEPGDLYRTATGVIKVTY